MTLTLPSSPSSDTPKQACAFDTTIEYSNIAQSVAAPSVPTILDLCSGTGAWSEPFVKRGFNVIRVDTRISSALDVRVWTPPPGLKVYGVLASPPCTEFANSGARWWQDKSPLLLDEAIRVVRGCLRIIEQCKPKWWALENPKGRIRLMVPELGAPSFHFQPYEYEDFHVKLTYVYGNVKKPPMDPATDQIMARAVARTSEYNIHHIGPSRRRDLLRGEIPPNFASAFAHQVVRQFPIPVRVSV